MWEGNTVWLPLSHALMRGWTQTHTCSLTGNRTGNLSLSGTMLQATEPHQSRLTGICPLLLHAHLQPAALFVTHEASTTCALGHEEGSTSCLCDSAVGALVVHRPIHVSLLVSILIKKSRNGVILCDKTFLQAKSWLYYTILSLLWLSHRRGKLPLTGPDSSVKRPLMCVLEREGKEREHELLSRVHISPCSESCIRLATLSYV